MAHKRLAAMVGGAVLALMIGILAWSTAGRTELVRLDIDSGVRGRGVAVKVGRKEFSADAVDGESIALPRGKQRASLWIDGQEAASEEITVGRGAVSSLRVVTSGGRVAVLFVGPDGAVVHRLPALESQPDDAHEVVQAFHPQHDPVARSPQEEGLPSGEAVPSIPDSIAGRPARPDELGDISPAVAEIPSIEPLRRVSPAVRAGAARKPFDVIRDLADRDVKGLWLWVQGSRGPSLGGEINKNLPLFRAPSRSSAEIADIDILVQEDSTATDAEFELLGELVGLKSLTFSGTRWTGRELEWFRGHRSLELVSYRTSGNSSGSQPSGEAPAFAGGDILGHLPELRIVQIRTLAISDENLLALYERTGLKVVNLGAGRLSSRGLSILSSLPDLESLVLSWDSLDGAGLDDGGLRRLLKPRLNTLTLTGCHAVTGTGFSGAGRLEDLKGLSLSPAPNLSDAGLNAIAESCPNLEWLFLDGADSITDAGLEGVAALGRLNVLRLRDSRLVTDAGLKALMAKQQTEAATGVDRLLATTNIEPGGASPGDSGLGAIEGNFPTGLETLDLSGASITDAGLAELEGRTSLRDLSLARTALSDAGCAHLARMTQLTHLDLSGTKITDDGLKLLRTIQKLQSLTLRDTQVSGELLAEIKRLRRIRTLIGPSGEEVAAPPPVKPSK